MFKIGKIDLHVHSIASSDGELSGRELIELALKEKVTTIAITDHDSINEVEETLYWGKTLGVEVIPGTEVFCKLGNRTFHMLGLYIDVNNPIIISFINDIISGRKIWVKDQIEIFRKQGLYAEEEKVYEFCRNTPPLHSSVAYAVINDERNKNHPLVNEYIKYANPLHEMSVRLMAYGKPLYTPHYIPNVKDFIDVVAKCGGISILAHPGYDQMRIDYYDMSIVDKMITYGLDGIEAYYITHTPEETLGYLEYCKRNNLLYTAGSDFHGKYKPNIKLGALNVTDYEIVNSLKKKLRVN